MKLDLNTIPFSRFGSYFAFSMMEAQESRPAGLYLRTVHGGGGAYSGPAFKLDLLVDGQPAPFEAQADESALELTGAGAEGGAARVTLCIPEPNVIRARGEGAGLRLTFLSPGDYDTCFPADGCRWQFVCASWDANLIFTPLAGQLAVDAPWKVSRSERVAFDLLPRAGACELAIEEPQCVWRPREYPGTFDEARVQAQAEFDRWLSRTPSLPDEYAGARRLAAYLTWSAVVEPEGHLTWQSMLMSKNGMASVWSWDHCFNAMALTYHQPTLAWDQMRVIFDQQDMYGALPDLVNDRGMVFSFVKPPIHGLALAWMMERTTFIRREQLHQIYGPLCRWTEWWFAYRDYDGDGIPQYHHGNDSGWDNATLFETGMPVESPDLSAFLALQMEALGQIAARLGLEEEAESWHRRSEALIQKLLAHFWQGDHFVAMRSGDHLVSDGESLLPFLPVILGKRLPVQVRADLINGLAREGRFLTAYGLATEAVQSSKYAPDGYWRGPIWAPPTWLIVQGLAECGEMALAKDIARRFCELCVRSGFAENFDALTGAGLRDQAYTWTASVFLLLGHEYLENT